MPIPRRLELKYLVPERIAQAFLEAAAPHIQPDEHSTTLPHDGYPVCSLYLDSADWLLFRHTVQGRDQRFKLRVRLYDSRPDSPVFCEIKHRRGQVVIKQRVLVPREWVHEALQGRVCEFSESPGSGCADDAESSTVWREFWRLRDQIGASPRLYVIYKREAYVGRQDNHARVTLDRQLLGSRYTFGEPLHVPTIGNSPAIPGVVLELKFDERFPAWMHQLVQRFQLERTSMPKYVECVRACGLFR